MNKHTPGPWVVSSTFLVCNKEAMLIANCTPFFRDITPSIGEQAANARLITAAPELLGACRDAEMLLDFYKETIATKATDFRKDVFERYVSNIKQAIAKAEGTNV